MSRTATAIAVVVIALACAGAFFAGRLAADDTPAQLRAVKTQPQPTATAGPAIVLPPKAVVP
jgi:hypothetical protein